MKQQYNTIERQGTAEFKDRGSKFLAYAYPVNSIDEFKVKLAALKDLHPKATHHCFAYRLNPDGEIFRVSDDGEPSGTAGKPILGQIDSKQLTNVSIIVVRYFGGTLLGVPGLINAYKTAASLVLQVIPIIRKEVLINYKISFNYLQLNDVMKIIKNKELEIIKQELQLFCSMTISIPVNQKEDILSELGKINNVEILVSG